MAYTAAGEYFPTNEDAWDPAGAMERGAKSRVGIIVPVINASARDAYLVEREAQGRPATPTDPAYVDRADTQTIERNDGSGWEVYARVDSGQVILRGRPEVSVTTTNLITTGPIAFDEPFASAPEVVPATQISSGGVVFNVAPIAISTTSFQMRIKASGSYSGLVTFPYVAIGPRAT